MILRHFIAVILGALLQVSLLGIGSASLAPAESDCSPSACCCTGEPSCPCVKSGGDEKPPVPAIPAGKEQQSPVIVPTEPEITSSGTTILPPAKLQATPAAGSLGGHRGVALRVSFCRYAI